MLSVASVSQSVCLSLGNTKKIMNGLQWNFLEGSGVVNETTDQILMAIRVLLDE